MRISTAHRTNRRGRFRKVAGAVVATAVASATLIPLTAGVAGAAVKATTTSIGTCTNFNAGSVVTCSIVVSDDTDSDDPSGSVSLNLSNLSKSSVVGTNSCTLVADTGRGKDQSNCSIKVTAWASGTLRIGVTYTSDDTANWADETSSASLKSLTVSNPTNMTPVTTMASTSSLGLATVDVYGANCSVSSGTAQGYVLVAYNADPTASGTTPWIIGPFTVASDKSWSWSSTIGANHPTGTFKARYVCADGAVTSKGDSDIEYTTGTYTTAISGTGGSTFTTAAARATDGSSVVLANGDVIADDGSGDSLHVSISVDPEELNDVDNMNVVKSNMDELKRRTDTLLPASSTVSRIGYALVAGGPDRASTEKWTAAVQSGSATSADVAAALLAAPGAAAFTTAADADFVAGLYQAALGREARPDEVASATTSLARRTTRALLVASVTGAPEAVAKWRDRSYVVAAFQTTTATMPTADQLGQFTAELSGGGIKVNTIENIAMTAATAPDWNAAVPLGRTPASAVFTMPGTAPAPAAGRPPVAAPRPAAGAPGAPKATPERRTTASKPRSAAVRKAAAKKAAAKKAAARKAALRKAAVRKAAAKKAAVRKAAAKKAAARKAAARRTAAVRR